MLKLIAALELIGGLLGFGFLNTYVAARNGSLLNLFGLVSFSFFSLCIVAGIELWRGSRRGIWFSLAAQVPQIILISTVVTGYRLQAGIQALVGVYPGGARVWFGFAAESLLGPDVPERQLIALNTAPVVFAGILLLKRRNLTKQHSISDTAPSSSTV